MDSTGWTRLGLDSATGRAAVAAVVLGAGLGAFFDGIVFHQLLQWHHLLTDHPDPAVASDLPLNTLAGGVLVGCGLFNLIEGLLAHQLLGLHHVRPGGPGGTLVWDVGYLLWGVAMLTVGVLVLRRTADRTRDTATVES